MGIGVARDSRIRFAAVDASRVLRESSDFEEDVGIHWRDRWTQSICWRHLYRWL